MHRADAFEKRRIYYLSSSAGTVRTFPHCFLILAFLILLISLLGTGLDIQHSYSSCTISHLQAKNQEDGSDEHEWARIPSPQAPLYIHSCFFAWLPTWLTVAMAYFARRLSTRCRFLYFVIFHVVIMWIFQIEIWAGRLRLPGGDSVQPHRLANNFVISGCIGTLLCWCITAWSLFSFISSSKANQREACHLSTLLSRSTLPPKAGQIGSHRGRGVSLQHRHMQLYAAARYSPPLSSRTVVPWGLFVLGAAFLLPMSCSGGQPAAVPTMVKVAPRSGPATGGTPVAISGNNFVQDNTFCKFFDSGGIVSALSVTQTRILCASQASGGALRTIIEVSNDKGQTFYSSGIPYTYGGTFISMHLSHF